MTARSKAKRPGVVRSALLLPANALGLLSAGVASLLLGDPTPAYVALGAQGLYLTALPFSARLRRSVRAGFAAVTGQDAEDEPALAQTVALLEDLAPNQREHYFALKELRDKILGNYGKLPGGGVLVASSEARVDVLLTNFLRLISTLNSYRKYLSSAQRTELEREAVHLRADADAEQDAPLRDVKRRRLDILQKRLERYAHAERSRELISHQLASIEDLLRLTHEQSIAIRDPDSLTHQLDALTAEAEATDATVRDMERFMSFTSIGEESPLPPAGRDRVRS